MHYIYFLLIFIFLFIFQACEYKSDISIPGYLEIDKITLEHENAIGITDAWVYVNGNIQGVYELPAKFPVIADGEAEISVYPGIKVNGISATRTYYPFYKPYETKIELKSGASQKISPFSSYASWVQVNVVDDFEKSEPKFFPGTDSDTIMYRTTDSFKGAYAGVVYLDSINETFSATSQVHFEEPNLSGNYSGVFLELNFKSDVFIDVGIVSRLASSIVYLQPTTEWKKIYIDLYTTLQNSSNGNNFVVYFRSNLGENQTKGTFYLDDIKIVHEKILE